MATLLSFQSPPSPQIIEQAVACIQAGGVLAIPTDSYYALAVGAFQSAALERLAVIKGDRTHKPFPVLIGDPSQLDELVDEVSENAQKLIQHFWPGLLTLVLKAKAFVQPGLLSESGSIGVRQPNDSEVCELLKRTGPLTGTSANRSGHAPAQSAEEVMLYLGTDIDLLLDSGPTPGGEPSTVLQIQPQFHILRQGKIPRSSIQDIVKDVRWTD